jgi:hypothetical protein
MLLYTDLTATACSSRSEKKLKKSAFDTKRSFFSTSGRQTSLLLTLANIKGVIFGDSGDLVMHYQMFITEYHHGLSGYRSINTLSQVTILLAI